MPSVLPRESAAGREEEGSAETSRQERGVKDASIAAVTITPQLHSERRESTIAAVSTPLCGWWWWWMGLLPKRDEQEAEGRG